MLILDFLTWHFITSVKDTPFSHSNSSLLLLIHKWIFIEWYLYVCMENGD